MNRDTQSVLLVLLGGAVVRISADDTYLRYVKSWTRPYLLLAGILLLVLGLVSLWREHLSRRVTPREPPNVGAGTDAASFAGRDGGVSASVDPLGQTAFGPGQAGSAGPYSPSWPAPPSFTGPDSAGSAGPHHEDDHGPVHDHGHGPRVAWLLLLPIFAIFLVAPPALGSYAAKRDGNDVAKPADSSQFAPLPAGDPVTTTLADYATRAIWDGGRSLQGRRIRLVGFVSPRPGGGYYVTRLVITCCAADARPIKIAVQAGDGQFRTDSWISVTGKYGGIEDTAGKREQIPIIQADAIQQVGVPSEPYES